MMKVIMIIPTAPRSAPFSKRWPRANPRWSVQPVVSARKSRARRVVNTIYVDDKIKDYIVDLVLATRNPKATRLDLNGYMSNRRFAARHHQSHARRARGRVPRRPRLRHAAGREKLAPDVLRHRVAVSYEAEAENITSEDIIQKILDTCPCREAAAKLAKGNIMNPERARPS
jgi:MoxR-like ATPase